MPEIQMTWTFTPEDYFEGSFILEVPGYHFEIDAGRVLARLPEAAVTHDLCNDAHAKVLAVFQSAQLIAAQAFTLSRPGSVARIDAEGNRHFVCIAEPAILSYRGGQVDSVTRDAHGGVVDDTKATRVRMRQELAWMALARVADPTASLIIRSYASAMVDPSNEFVYLYEIRDALVRKCGGDGAAQTAVGVSAARWSIFGRLTNGEPLNQGRHRGKGAEMLRDATQEELDEARGIARDMIFGYFRWIARPPQT